MTSGWIFIALGLALGLPVFLAAKGVLKPNRFIGIRTRSVRRSPEVWQAANAAAAPILVPVGFLAVLFGIGVVLDWPAGMADLGGSHGLVGAFVIIIAAIMSARTAEKAAQASEQPISRE
ncbi:SdpI family protein [Arthrobacter flavus]|uniref:SdpI family protein n=1 Tax=Arthrobacter flavus TaxID=95172 RepID=A0ABW4Q9J4_9MICC